MDLTPDFQRRYDRIQKDIVIPDRPIEIPRPEFKLPHRDGLLKPSEVTQPSDSLLTKNQHHMLLAFRKVGRQGLTDAIYKIAADIVETHPSASSMYIHGQLHTSLTRSYRFQSHR